MDRIVIVFFCIISISQAFSNISLNTQPLTDKLTVISPSEKLIPEQKSNPSSKITLKDIKTLREAGKLKEAEEAAINYLRQYPKDVDALLLLGLIYAQEENDTEAEKYLNAVLQQSPQYLDARIALINLKIKQKQYQDASKLIEEGLSKNPKQVELVKLKTTLLEKKTASLDKNKEVVVKEEKKTKADSQVVLTEIQTLRQEGKLELAKKKALNYLVMNPKDSDVALILSLIYLQEKDYTSAETRLEPILKQTPSYTDARIALIRIKIFQKKYQEAQSLLDDGLKITPQDKALQLLKEKFHTLTTKSVVSSQKKITQIIHRLKPKENSQLTQAKRYIHDRQFYKAESLLKYFVEQEPNNTDFRIALADCYLAQHKDMQALRVIRKGLAYTPQNRELLIKKGEINATLHEYSLAARSYQQTLILSPDNKVARNLLAEINEISPNYTYGIHEIGISTDNAYVSDLHKVWDYSSLYFSQDTDFGSAAAKINYASRQRKEAAQYELDLSPRFNRNSYVDLFTAYSNQPALFPNYMVGAEGFMSLPFIRHSQFFELSAGGKYSKIKATFFRTYTGSFSIYPKTYWLSFRPNYFVPKNTNKSSILYTGRIRKYFSTVDHYVGIGLGTGRSPDLANLLTVNFLVIKNSFINMEYTFPILKHKLLVNLGAGYQRWKYPSNLVRRLYDGAIGFRYRF